MTPVRVWETPAARAHTHGERRSPAFAREVAASAPAQSMQSGGVQGRTPMPIEPLRSRVALLLCLAAHAGLAASCEVVLGLHDPPKAVVDKVDAAEDATSWRPDGGADGATLGDAAKPGDAVTHDDAAIHADADAHAGTDAESGDGAEMTSADAKAEAATLPDARTDNPMIADAAADTMSSEDAASDADREASLAEGLVVRYAFDDPASKAGSLPMASDSSGSPGGPRNATLVTTAAGSPTFSKDRQVGSQSLAFSASDPTSGPYATTLPSPGLRDLGPSSLTVAVWIFVADGGRKMQRIFDFGASGGSPKSYMFLTPTRPDINAETMRFAISRDGPFAEEIIDGPPPALNEWHHVAVVLPAGAPYTGRLYVDGVLQGLNPKMTLHAADLGATDQNFLARSQFAADPTFVGKLDDFRIYARALSDVEIVRLAKLH